MIDNDIKSLNKKHIIDTDFDQITEEFNKNKQTIHDLAD